MSPLEQYMKTCTKSRKKHELPPKKDLRRIRQSVSVEKMAIKYGLSHKAMLDVLGDYGIEGGMKYKQGSDVRSYRHYG